MQSLPVWRVGCSLARVYQIDRSVLEIVVGLRGMNPGRIEEIAYVCVTKLFLK